MLTLQSQRVNSLVYIGSTAQKLDGWMVKTRPDPIIFSNTRDPTRPEVEKPSRQPLLIMLEMLHKVDKSTGCKWNKKIRRYQKVIQIQKVMEFKVYV